MYPSHTNPTEDSPSRLSWASEDSWPEPSCWWRNWMMEKARRLVSAMLLTEGPLTGREKLTRGTHEALNGVTHLGAACSSGSNLKVPGSIPGSS